MLRDLVILLPGRKSLLLVASTWGKEAHPDWFHNLIAHPQTTIQVIPTKIQVEAHQAQGEEHTRLWEVVTH